MANDDDRRVELVRVPRQEKLFEREQVFGRDASSVFPTEGQRAAAEAAEALKSKLGANRFISESEIQELQKEYGGSTEGSEPIKPLAHILLEAKQAKEEAFQNQWKQMKQGKNRPLDEEEVQFVDALEAARQEKEQAEHKQEVDALEAYQLAVRAAAEARQSPSDAEPGPLPPRAAAKPIGPRRPPAASKPSKAKPVIIRKRTQPPADTDAQQDVGPTANKQARLEREEVDVVSTSLPTPSAGMSHIDAQIRASVAAAGVNTNVQTTQMELPLAVQSHVREPSGTSAADQSHATQGIRKIQALAPKEMEAPQNGSLLTSFLGNYGSDSDDAGGTAT